MGDATGGGVAGAGARAPRGARSLGGAALAAARAAWLAVAALTIGIFAAGVPARYAQLQVACAGRACPPSALTGVELRGLEALHLPVAAYAAALVGLDVLSACVWCAVAAAIFWRRSADPVALFSALTLLTFGAGRFPDVPLALAAAHPAWTLPVDALRFLGSACLSVFVYVFPDGRFVPWWTRWTALAWLVPQVPEFFFPASALSAETFPAPLLFAAFLGFVGSVAVAQVYRYARVSDPSERRQTRWVVFGMVVALTAFLVLNFGLPLAASTAVAQPDLLAAFAVRAAAVLAMLLIPLCIGIAILRARLWDIDLIINRALVYGALSAALGLVYLASILGSQALVRAISGQDSPAAIAVSTLLIAALFQPLRRRVQGGIDRRFYRRRYDAARTLEAFAASLRQEVNLDRLSAHLVEAVRETMQPEHVSLWLRARPGAREKRPPEA